MSYLVRLKPRFSPDSFRATICVKPDPGGAKSVFPQEMVFEAYLGLGFKVGLGLIWVGFRLGLGFIQG